MNSPATRVEARWRFCLIEEVQRDAKQKFGGSLTVTSPRVFNYCSHYRNDPFVFVWPSLSNVSRRLD